MKQQRGKFLNFLFALIPGAAQMYMGFMRRGLSLMAAACLVIMTAILVDGIGVAFLFPLIWFYAFFDAINLNNMPPQLFADTADEPFYTYLTESKRLLGKLSEKSKTMLGVVVICVGGFLLLRNISVVFYDIMPDSVYYFLRHVFNMMPRIAVALLIIWIGIRVIIGSTKKQNFNQDDSYSDYGSITKEEDAK
ncbi:MAG: hypothetical protein ACC608_06025 [Anaerofustis sp.]